MPTQHLLALSMVCLALPAAQASVPAAASISVVDQDLGDQRSPFEDLRWVAAGPEVQIDGTWYAPSAVDGVPTDELLKFCESVWPGRGRKRYAEDMVEAMGMLGDTPGATVEVVATRLSDGEQVTLPAVPMTSNRRRAVMHKDTGGAAPIAPPIAPPIAAPVANLGRRHALADADQFGRDLGARFAYLGLGSVDLDAELELLKREVEAEGASMKVVDLAASLDRILLQFGDGHAGVNPPAGLVRREELHLPFLLERSAGGVVAVLPDRSGMLDGEFPYVVSLDGEPLEDWLEAERPLVAAGSAQLVERRTRRGLRQWNRVRVARGLAAGTSVTLGLAGDPGARSAQKELEVPLGASRPVYGTWPRSDSKILPGDIGYLRIEGMDDDLVPELHATMADFKGTSGLVVDVRANGGGSRGLLVALAGYLRMPDDKPWIANVAAFRTPAFDAGHLDARFMHAAKDPRLTPDQIAAIEAFAPGFRPELELGSEFSEWHYLVLGPTGDEREFAYEHPVVVLSDAGCFSATDIFLGALGELPQVTLMGAASSGGSARTQSFVLGHSGIEVRCASMASFRPDGRLYDGRGIEVDAEVLPTPEFFSLGGADPALEAALKQLR